MFKILKKVLLFLFILVIASILFNVSASNNVSSSASEVIEIIEQEGAILDDGYINDVSNNTEGNIFVDIISGIANIITSVVSFILSFFSKIISSFTSN